METDRLLRQIRGLRLGILACLGLNLAVLLCGAGKGILPEVSTRSLTIVDAEGRPRIMLRAQRGDGYPGASLALLDDQGRVRSMIACPDEGSPMLSVRDPRVNGSVILGLVQGHGAVILTGAEGQVWSAPPDQ